MTEIWKGVVGVLLEVFVSELASTLLEQWPIYFENSVWLHDAKFMQLVWESTYWAETRHDVCFWNEVDEFTSNKMNEWHLSSDDDDFDMITHINRFLSRSC